MVEITNAVIKSARLGVEDHNVLTANLDLDYGGVCQGFGGYRLDPAAGDSGRFGGLFIRRVLEVAGVGEWSRLPGRAIRVQRSGPDIVAIGHIINDDWLRPSALLTGREL